MRNTYLVIETENNVGKVAYVETVSPYNNLKGYADNKKIRSISAYAVKKQAQEQAEMLNDLYRKDI